MNYIEKAIDAICKRRDLARGEYELEGEERELMEKIYPGFRKTSWDKLQAYNETIFILKEIVAEEKNKKEV